MRLRKGRTASVERIAMPVRIPTKLDTGKLTGTGFSLADEVILAAVLMSIGGLEGSGKSHLAFSSAVQGPVAYQYTDRRHDGVIQKFYGGAKYAKIATSEYGYRVPKGIGVVKGASSEQIQAAMSSDLKRAIAALEDVIDRFQDDFFKALDAGFRTIIWDTESELWELFRAARFLKRFGRMEKVPTTAYGEVNAEFRGLIREAKRHGTNLVLLRKLKKEYKGDAWTGGYYPAGFGETAFLADISLRMAYDEKTRLFTGVLTKSGQKQELTGQTFINPTFTSVVQQCWPHDDWRPDPDADGIELGDGDALEV